MFIQLFTYSITLFHFNNNYYRPQKSKKIQKMSSSSTTFDDIKSEIEQDIKLLTASAQQLIQNACTIQNSKCQTKSYDQCQGTSQKYCIDQYPKLLKCPLKGAKISYNSGIRLPPNSNSKNISDYQKLIICATTSLDQTFRYIKEKYMDQIDRLYIGTKDNFLRIYPGIQQPNKNGVCLKPFAPKERVWYVGAATGSKNIIIALDISAGMAQGPIKSAKAAVIQLISTLGFNDFVSLIFFSSSAAQQIYPKTLMRATTQVIRALTKLVQNIDAISETNVNYQATFQKITQIYNTTTTDDYGSPCASATNIVLFLTASPPTAGLKTGSELISVIKNTKINFKFFAYGLSTKVDYSILKQLACQYQGNFFSVSEYLMTQNLLKNIKYYQKLLAVAINVDSPIWSEPYNDFFSGERMVTVSIPIYFYQNFHRTVFGVVGIDVLMKYMKQYGISQQKAKKSLIKCTPSQPVFFDPCLTQQFRSLQQKCNTPALTCPSESSPALSCNYTVFSSITQPPIYTNFPLQSQGCCKLQPNQLIGIIVACAVVVIVVLSLFVGWLVKKERKRREKQLLGSSSNSNLNKGTGNSSSQLVYRESNKKQNLKKNQGNVQSSMNLVNVNKLQTQQQIQQNKDNLNNKKQKQHKIKSNNVKIIEQYIIQQKEWKSVQ